MRAHLHGSRWRCVHGQAALEAHDGDRRAQRTVLAAGAPRQAEGHVSSERVELMRDLISFALRRAQALPKIFGFDLAPCELFFELSALAALLFELTLRALVLRLDKIELLLEIADLALALRLLGAQLDQGLLLLSLVISSARNSSP